MTHQFISAKQITVAKSLLSWCIYCVCMYLVWYWRMNGKINSTVVFLLILIWTENLHVLHIHQRPCSPYYLKDTLHNLVWYEISELNVRSEFNHRNSTRWLNTHVLCYILKLTPNQVTTKWAAIKKNSQPTATQIGKDRTTHLVDGPLSHILWGQLHYM